MIKTAIKSVVQESVKSKSLDETNVKETKLPDSKSSLMATDKEISNHNKLTENDTDKSQRLEERFNAEKYEAKLYENHPSRLNVIDQADKLFKNVDGYLETRNLTLSSNMNKARGHFGEIVRGIRAERAGYSVEAFGKYVNNRETDIDLLLKNKDNGKLTWLENKEVHSGISNDNDFKVKIDKMSNAIKHGVVDADNNFIKPDKAVFMNSGSISENAKLYAKERNVEIFDNVKSNKQAEEILKEIRGS